MTKQDLIDQLENAMSYSEHCPHGRWERDIFIKAVKAALTFLNEQYERQER